MAKPSPKVFYSQATALDDTFQRADWNGFVSVHGDNYLTSILMPPFLMTTGLSNEGKPVLTENSDNFLCVANWKALAHETASSTSFAPFFNLTGDGSNQSRNASLAFAMASSSVSPAEAHPGNSGKTADHRFVSGSCSTKSRNFM